MDKKTKILTIFQITGYIVFIWGLLIHDPATYALGLGFNLGTLVMDILNDNFNNSNKKEKK